jgi:hypothetical protein
MSIVNALRNPVLAVCNCHYEAQRVNTLYIFRAYLFVMPFEEFRTSAYTAVQCTGEENCACRCLDTASGNNFIRCFFLGHFRILSYCAFRGRKNLGYAHARQRVFGCCVEESPDCRVYFFYDPALLALHQRLQLRSFHLFLCKQQFGAFLQDVFLAFENLECFGIFRADN